MFNQEDTAADRPTTMLMLIVKLSFYCGLNIKQGFSIFLSDAQTMYSTLREKQSNDVVYFTALNCVDSFDFNKHLNTVTVEIHQLCSLRAPERDTLLSSDVGLEFSPSWENSMSQLTQAALSFMFARFEKRWRRLIGQIRSQPLRLGNNNNSSLAT